MSNYVFQLCGCNVVVHKENRWDIDLRSFNFLDFHTGIFEYFLFSLVYHLNAEKPRSSLFFILDFLLFSDFNLK